MSVPGALQRYPVLQPGLELHLTPRGGMLFSHGSLHKLDLDESEFLRRCDGRHRLAELIPARWTGEYSEARFLLFGVAMTQSGWVRISGRPRKAALRVTGSRRAFIPPHMGLELTEGCNLQCRYCYRESGPAKHHHMPAETLLELIGRLHSAGLRSVELTGGEPMLHRDFSRILEECSRRFELTGVLSNGTLLTDPIAEQLRALGDRVLISLSLDGSTPAIHDLRRGVPGAWARTTAAIRRLASMGVKVRVSMCVDDESFDDLENTLLLARNLGAFAFNYTPVLPMGRGKPWAPGGWNLDGRTARLVEESIARRYKGFLAVLPEEAVCEIEGEDGCGAGYRTFTMDPFGRVRPCATFGADDLIFGDLTAQTAEEVFSHPAIPAMADLRTPSPAICGACKYSNFCRYCSLRALQASQWEPACTWIRQPALTQILPHRKRGTA